MQEKPIIMGFSGIASEVRDLDLVISSNHMNSQQGVTALDLQPCNICMHVDAKFVLRQS